MPSFAESVEGACAALRGVERWLLPPACLLCERDLPVPDGDTLVCAVCRTRWSAVPHPLCVRCGQPLSGAEGCRLCAGWPVGLERVQSAVWLDGSAREAAHRLKYDGWWRIADAMALAMKALAPLTPEVSLVPIPLSAKRRRSRGYNQSERIADALSRALRLPVEDGLLRRVRETPTQTALPPEARHANVANAFQASACDGRAVVLVDDVFTTGATLVAAADALRAGGARRVEAVTFARARPPVG